MKYVINIKGTKWFEFNKNIFENVSEAVNHYVKEKLNGEVDLTSFEVEEETSKSYKIVFRAAYDMIVEEDNEYDAKKKAKRLSEDKIKFFDETEIIVVRKY